MLTKAERKFLRKTRKPCTGKNTLKTVGVIKADGSSHTYVHRNLRVINKFHRSIGVLRDAVAIKQELQSV